MLRAKVNFILRVNCFDACQFAEIFTARKWYYFPGSWHGPKGHISQHNSPLPTPTPFSPAVVHTIKATSTKMLLLLFGTTRLKKSLNNLSCFMLLGLYCKGGMKIHCEKLTASLHKYYYFTHVFISFPFLLTFTFLHQPALLLLKNSYQVLQINGKYFSQNTLQLQLYEDGCNREKYVLTRH